MEQDQPQTTKSERPQSPRFWKVYAGSFVYVFLFGLPGLQMLTVNSSAFMFHFGMDLYVWFLFFSAIFALPIAGLMHVVWLPTRRLEPLQRVIGALLLTFPIPVYLQLAALKLEWFGVAAGLEHRYALIVWVALMLPIAVSGKVFRGARKGAAVLAKLLSPLPLVMAFSLLGMPQVSSVEEPQPAEIQNARQGSPVYLLVFDALDRERVFRPENAKRFPALFNLKDTGVWFADSRTYGSGTVNVVPCLLHQRRAEVTRNDNGDYLLDGTSTDEIDSLLTTLGDENSMRVAGGFHLNYSNLLKGETDWLREYSMYSRRDGIVGPLRTSAQLFAGHIYLPDSPPINALQAASGTHTFADDTIDFALRNLEAQLMACASSPNHDMVAFFHMPVPHAPFIYDRQGRRLRSPDPHEEQDEAYLKNVEYVDAMLRRFIEALKSSGQWQSATLVVTGDHGMQYGDRPPLIVRLPGQEAGRAVREEFYSTELVEWLARQP